MGAAHETGLRITLIPSYPDSILGSGAQALRQWTPSHLTGGVKLTGYARHHNNYLILRTIQHATKTFTRGTLVIPAWSSAPFWPVLYPNGCEPVSFIKETVMLLKSQSVVLSGMSGWSLPSCDVLVIRFEFPTS